MRTVGVSAKVERYSGVVENGWKAFQFWEAVWLGVICKRGERRYEMMFYCSRGVERSSFGERRLGLVRTGVG